MKYEISKYRYGQSIIIATVEANNAYNAVKQITKSYENIAKLRKFGVNVFSVGRVGCLEFERTRYTVTEVADAIAYGANGQVLSYDETTEAIANRQGWFDRSGRWVNYARMMKEAREYLAVK